MARNEVDPVTVPDPQPGSPDATVTTHPAFGQISLVRQSGGGLLYGSPHDHQYCVSLQISHSEMHRHLANDWHHDRSPIISINLTEAQWSEFVSSTGQGAGVCCTLRYTEKDGRIPGIARSETRMERYAVEHDAALTTMQQGITELRSLLTDAKMTVGARGEMMGKLSTIENGLKNSIPFIKEQFAEFVEETASAIRAEQNGLARLAIAEPPALQIEAAEEPKDITPRVRERTRISKED